MSYEGQRPSSSSSPSNRHSFAFSLKHCHYPGAGGGAIVTSARHISHYYYYFFLFRKKRKGKGRKRRKTSYGGVERSPTYFPPSTPLSLPTRLRRFREDKLSLFRPILRRILGKRWEKLTVDREWEIYLFELLIFANWNSEINKKTFEEIFVCAGHFSIRISLHLWRSREKRGYLAGKEIVLGTIWTMNARTFPRLLTFPLSKARPPNKNSSATSACIRELNPS